MKPNRYYAILNILLLFILLNSNCTNTAVQPTSALTFRLNGGRFGDILKNYCTAKWIAYKHGLSLFYPPFNYSNQLVLGTEEQKLTYHKEKKFKPLQVDYESNTTFFLDNNTLYITNYYTIPNEWKGVHYANDMFMAFTKDKLFLTTLKHLIQPTIVIDYLDLPKNRLTVAVHVRRGGGFDPPLLHKGFADVAHPTKFPPDEYFIDQINRISTMLNDEPLYVHIFTDDKNPSVIAKKYQNALNKSNIAFGFRKTGNSAITNVLDDFFNMTRFDCLIRGTSSFTEIVQVIGSHKIIISALHGTWYNTKLVIDKIGIVEQKNSEYCYTILDV